MPHRFNGWGAYDEQLKEYIFTDTSTRVPDKGSMYVVFHEPTKRYFRYNPTIEQFRLTKAKDCDWTTRYFLCKDFIFNQMTGQTNYFRQNRT